MNICVVGQMNYVQAVSGPVNASFGGSFSMSANSNVLESLAGAVFSVGSLQEIVTVKGAAAGGADLVGWLRIPA